MPFELLLPEVDWELDPPPHAAKDRTMQSTKPKPMALAQPMKPMFCLSSSATATL